VLGFVEQEALGPTRARAKDLDEAVADAPLLRATLPLVAGVNGKKAFERSVRILLAGLVGHPTQAC